MNREFHIRNWRVARALKRLALMAIVLFATSASAYPWPVKNSTADILTVNSYIVCNASNECKFYDATVARGLKFTLTAASSQVLDTIGSYDLIVKRNGVETLTFGAGALTFNNGNADIDLTIKGDTAGESAVYDAGTGAVTVNQNAAGATPEVGTALENDTAAATGAQQSSPTLELGAYGWGAGGGGSKSVKFDQFVLPVQAATTPTGTWKLRSNIAAAGAVDQLTVTSAGVVTSTGNIVAGAAGANMNATTGRVSGVSFGLPSGALVRDGTGSMILHPLTNKQFIVENAAQDTNYFVVETTAASAKVEINSSAADVDFVVKADSGADVFNFDAGAGLLAMGQPASATAVIHGIAGLRTKHCVADVATPPTQANADTCFGDAAAAGQGYIGTIDDNGAGTALWQCMSTGGTDKWGCSSMVITP